MRALRLIAAVVATAALAILPVRADQILGPGRVVSGTNAVVLPGGPTLGLWSGGKFTATPDTVQIQGGGSTGDVSGMSVTPTGGTAGALSGLLAAPSLMTRMGLQQAAPTVAVPFDATPRLGRLQTLSDGTDAAPITGTDPSPSIFMSRVDQNTPGAGFQGRLLSLHYKRLDGGNGSIQGFRSRVDDYSTAAPSETVAVTGISNVFGPGAGWGLYAEGWAHAATSRATGLEIDAANNTASDFAYADADPTSGGHTKGLWLYGKKASAATGRNTFAIGISSQTNAEFQTGFYTAPKRILKYGFDLQATPPIGMKFAGASIDGLGVTPGGIGIDMGPAGFGYGTAADQGAIHLRRQRLLAGNKSTEGGTGLTYLQFNTTTNRWEFWSEGTLGLEIGKSTDSIFPANAIQMASGKSIRLTNATAGTTYPALDNVSDFTILRAGASGTIFRSSADANLLLVQATIARPGADNAYGLGAAAFRFNDTYSVRFRPGAGAVQWTSGAGTPLGTVTAVPGSLYTRTDGAAGTTLYVKETGTDATGWTAK